MRKPSKLIFAAISLVAALSFMGCPKDVPVEETTLESVVNSSTTGTVDLSTVTDIDSFTGNVSKAVTITGGSSAYDMKNATLTIKAAGVTLKNLKNLDVVVDAAVGDGDFNLVGCTVNNLTVNGGGANSIHVDGCTVTIITVSKEDVRIVLENEASITTVNVNSNALLEATDAIAKFGTVTIADDKAAVTIAATVTTLEAGSGTVTLTSKEGIPATVTTLKATKDAKVFVISSTVTVTTVTVTKVNDSDTTSKIDIITTDDATGAQLPTGTVNTKGIKVTNCVLPTKTSYKVGGSIDTTGFSATLVETTNGVDTETTLTADDVTFSGFDSSKAGNCTVKITYSGINVGTYTCTIQADTTKERTPTTDIKSEADLINCFIDSYNEYAAYFHEQSSNRTAATTSADATTQINALIQAVMDNYVNIYAFMEGTALAADVNINKEIDLANIDVNETLDTFGSVYAYIYNTYEDATASDITSTDAIKSLFGSSYDVAMKYVDALQNSGTNIDKLYLKPVLTINKDATGSGTYATASLTENLSLSSDANKLIKYITGIETDSEDVAMAYLPLSTFSAGVNTSLNASVTKDNYTKLSKFDTNFCTTSTTRSKDDFVVYEQYDSSYSSDGSFSYTTKYTILDYEKLEDSISDLSATANAYIKAMICSSTGLGGNVKAQVNFILTDNYISTYCKACANLYYIDDPNTSDYLAMLDKLFNVTISSTNTSGTTTWSNTYTCTGLYNMVNNSILPRVQIGMN